jgi:hypothetical protein
MFFEKGGNSEETPYPLPISFLFSQYLGFMAMILSSPGLMASILACPMANDHTIWRGVPSLLSRPKASSKCRDI